MWLVHRRSPKVVLALLGTCNRREEDENAYLAHLQWGIAILTGARTVKATQAKHTSSQTAMILSVCTGIRISLTTGCSPCCLYRHLTLHGTKESIVCTGGSGSPAPRQRVAAGCPVLLERFAPSEGFSWRWRQWFSLHTGTREGSRPSHFSAREKNRLASAERALPVLRKNLKTVTEYHVFFVSVIIFG